MGRREVIVADTHALLWWIGDRSQLSMRAREALDHDMVGVAVITCFEIVRLAERRRITLTQEVVPWIESMLALPNLMLLPFTPAVAVKAAQLSDPVRDPIDRIIVATALQYHAPLVTKDHKILAANIVPTLW